MQRHNRSGRIGLSSLQKVTIAIRLLACRKSFDSFDKYFGFATTTWRECLKRFCKTVINVYSVGYLRRTNWQDVNRLYELAEEQGFLGMLGSLDCIHREWKNYPTAWHVMSKGKHDKPIVILEAVASSDLWVWHSFFGLPGTLNDVNILQRSPLFAKMAEGNDPSTSFTVNGHKYERDYYLFDGTYPRDATFVQTIHELQTR